MQLKSMLNIKRINQFLDKFIKGVIRTKNLHKTLINLKFCLLMNEMGIPTLYNHAKIRLNLVAVEF